REVLVRVPGEEVVLLVLGDPRSQRQPEKLGEALLDLTERGVGGRLERIRRARRRVRPGVRIRNDVAPGGVMPIGRGAERPPARELLRREGRRPEPPFVVIAVDAQTIDTRGPVETLVAAVQARFQRLLVDLAAVEELE